MRYKTKFMFTLSYLRSTRSYIKSLFAMVCDQRDETKELFTSQWQNIKKTGGK